MKITDNFLCTQEEFDSIKHRDEVFLECKKCKRKFKRKKSSILLCYKRFNNYPLYCSLKCFPKFDKTTIVCNCAYCGKKIEKLKCNITKNKNNFCNSSCAAKFNNKNREPCGGLHLNHFLKSFEKNKNSIFYILKCFNDHEEFYKVGITSKSIKERYKSKKCMPYNYIITQEIYIEPTLCFNFEKQLKKYLKKYKYKPLLKFDGYTECFKI